MTRAASDQVDEVGLSALSMGLVAERLGVNTSSLYKHVTSLADLVHRVGVLAMVEFGDALREAIQGRAGRDALAAGARSMRSWVNDHPGRYAAGNSVVPTGPDDPLVAATQRVLGSWAAMLHGYRLDPRDEVHALRMLRSVLHGFATLEADGGFHLDVAVDDSFAWMIDFVDHGLRSVADASSTLVTS